MARPRSEDKRDAILSAAAKVFAERGLGAPTSAISRAAGVAEGTLFMYFSTKDELVNALYRDIKGDLANAMMSGLTLKMSVRDRLRHVWDNYVGWGVANPAQHRALKQIETWSGLTQESIEAGSAMLAELQAAAEAVVKQHVLRELPLDFIGATINALAETTIGFMRKDPQNADVYRSAGFDILWAGLTRDH